MATGLLLVGAPAFAQPPVTEVIVRRNLVETFVESLGCDESGPPFTITTASDHVEHTTTFDDGRVGSTFSAKGTFVAVPLNGPSLPSFTGSFTAQGRVKLRNNEVVNGTSTFSERGRARTGLGSPSTPPGTSTSAGRHGQ